MAKREDYTTIITYVASRGTVSYHRASKAISELGKVLQDAVLQGNDLNIPGIFTISYQATDSHIYRNMKYGIADQVAEVVKRTGMPENEVFRLVSLYYRRMKDLIEIGYQVNVKGVGYVIPKNDGEGVYCDTRVSPVLEKPEVADFMMMHDDGSLYVGQLTKDELRFSIELSDEVKIPYKVLESTELNLKEVNI